MRVLLIFFLVFLVNIYSFENIECNWSREYLCGDQCLDASHGIGTRLCNCGNEAMTYADTEYHYCCNYTPCEKDIPGNVYCNGTKEEVGVPCNGVCKQAPRFGHPFQLCDNQEECYFRIDSCLGKPLCSE